MVRSLAQWTKTLSFPSRISPNRNSKDCGGANVHQINPSPPTPPRNKTQQQQQQQQQQSVSSSPQPANVPITEISQIVSRKALAWINRKCMRNYGFRINSPWQGGTQAKVLGWSVWLGVAAGTVRKLSLWLVTVLFRGFVDWTPALLGFCSLTLCFTIGSFHTSG